MTRKIKAKAAEVTANPELIEMEVIAMLETEIAVEEIAAETVDEILVAEAPAETPTEAPATDEPVNSTFVPGDLVEMLGAVDDQAKGYMIERTQANFDERARFELMMRPMNDSVTGKLKAYCKKMAVPGNAGMMIATNIDPDFVNRSINDGRRFNIYAIDKLNDLLAGLNSGSFKNAVNIAVMKSLFKHRAAGVPFTGLSALAAVSDKVKVEKGMTAVLVRHTTSAATAPTQSSSTFNALATMGVVKNKGSIKFPIWELTDTPVTRRIETLIAA